MATIKKFEDLLIWQKARELSKIVFVHTNNEKFFRSFKFIDQWRSASGSIMDNIAEGYGRKGNKEFRQFLSIASGSCLEVQSQAYRALDYDFITEEEFKALYELSNEIYFRIGKFSEYLSQTEYKGSKYLT